MRKIFFLLLLLNSFFIFSGGFTPGIISYNSVQFIVATCSGSETTNGDYKTCVFNSSGNWNATAVPGGATVETLVVGGGGGYCDGSATWPCGGGGAGGYQYFATFPVSVQNYSITVGAGGAAGFDGGNSVFDSITSIGGGHAGAGNSGGNAQAGFPGGSGGGGGQGISNTPAGGLGTAGQGNDGYRGSGIGDPGFEAGGGGGCGGAAPPPNYATSEDAGGPGCANSITGTSVTYAVGGWGRDGYLNPSTWAQNTGNGVGDASGNTTGRDGIVVIKWKYQ